MADELYLIAHLCRGEATFDIAVRQDCPICHPGYDMPMEHYCSECNNVGYWWILATPGYRAYPWWVERLDRCIDLVHVEETNGRYPPSDAIDVFACNDRPSTTALAVGARSLLAKLGLTKPQAPIKRRF